jgi:hypothetical protein
LTACTRQGSVSRWEPAEFQQELSGSVLYTAISNTPRQQNIELRLEPPLSIQSSLSLVVEYRSNDALAPFRDKVNLALRCFSGDPSFILPWDTSGETIRYAVPLAGDSLE